MAGAGRRVDTATAPFCDGVESSFGRCVEAVDGALQDPVRVSHCAKGGVDAPGAVGRLAVVPGVFL